VAYSVPGKSICHKDMYNETYISRNYNILLASQAALKALCSFSNNSKLDWDFLLSLMTKAEPNRTQLI
jgi:hypothetical protein